MPYFPAGASFFTAHFAPASWFRHLFLHNQPKIFIPKSFRTLRIYGIIEKSKSKKAKGYFVDLDCGVKMIQCKDCELCEIGPDGRRSFKCDPFTNIKEPECIAKWQLIRLDMLVANYRGMLKWYEKLAPLQDKIFKYMKRESEDLDESEHWKLDDEEDQEEENNHQAP